MRLVRRFGFGTDAMAGHAGLPGSPLSASGALLRTVFGLTALFLLLLLPVLQPPGDASGESAALAAVSAELDAALFATAPAQPQADPEFNAEAPLLPDHATMRRPAFARRRGPRRALDRGGRGVQPLHRPPRRPSTSPRVS